MTPPLFSLSRARDEAPDRSHDSTPGPAHGSGHDAADEVHDHDRGLDHDLPRLLSRRRALGMVGLGVGASAALAACGDDLAAGTSSRGPGGAPPGGGADAGSGVSVAANEIPEETAGPYPGDGSNGANVLSESGVVRSDVTSSFGDADGVADGVPLTIDLTVLDVDGDARTPYAGAAVYLWHCDAQGRYSLYSEDVVEENYLRGVQEADADGKVRFTSIFPACYDGRWPHIHFEVYPSLDEATNASQKMRTSQIALPQDVASEVYADARYAGSSDNLSRVSLDSDMVFSDGYRLQMATMSGSVADGLTARLTVPV